MTLGYVTRDGTVDANAVYALADDEYRLWDRTFSGWAIDVGAQIGTVGISLAQQNPDLRVVCVEAVPESSDVLEQNIRALGMGRVYSVRAWAGGPNDLTGTCHYGYRGGDVESDGYVSAHRFVGNTWMGQRNPEFSVELPAVSLDALISTYDMPDVAVLKIDCEGCEWAFLDTPAVARVALISGEYHGGITGVEDPQGRLHELLDATHDLVIWDTQEKVSGLFEATRR